MEAGSPTATAFVYGLMVVGPVGVGAYAWRREPDNRFGPLLMLAGLAFSLVTLAATDSSGLYSAGRVAGWLMEPIIILLVLSFPAGRLEGWAARTLMLAPASLWAA